VADPARPPDPAPRSSLILAGLGGRRDLASGVRSTLIAIASTAIVVGLIASLLPRTKGYEEVKAAFFDRAEFRASLPEVWHQFGNNVKIFLIVEAIVLVTALLLAVMRGLPGPVFFPIRVLATIYADVFRGIPTILLILLLGLGMPGLQIEGITPDPMVWAIVALVLVYTAYVSEVYRAGIISVHPSQDAAARSLGLTRAQSLRHVVIPQAVRRVVPPLLNDFIGLQKDTALVSTLGVVEALRQAQINASTTFNFTPYVAAAVLFLAITIPLTRLTDWLLARDMRRRQGGGAVA